METPPFIRYVRQDGCLQYGRRPNVEGWSRVVGWDEGVRYVPALGAGIVHVSEMRNVVELGCLPVWAMGHGVNADG